jgi:hypothetical protein
LVATCSEIEKRYEVCFLEVGTDKHHVHFLIQSVPSYSVTKIVTMVKSILAREVFRQCPEVKKQLWGGEFWGRLLCEHRRSAWNRECHCQICQGAGNRKRVQSVEKRLSVEIILMPRGLAPRIIYFGTELLMSILGSF